MTANQKAVLLALNLKQMQRADFSNEGGVWTEEVASVCGRSNRSVATILSQMRDFGWVQSIHNSEAIGWCLVRKGVDALEANR